MTIKLSHTYVTPEQDARNMARPFDPWANLDTTESTTDHYTLTDEHPQSSHGQMVLLDTSGTIINPDCALVKELYDASMMHLHEVAEWRDALLKSFEPPLPPIELNDLSAVEDWPRGTAWE